MDIAALHAAVLSSLLPAVFAERSDYLSVIVPEPYPECIAALRDFGVARRTHRKAAQHAGGRDLILRKEQELLFRKLHHFHTHLIGGGTVGHVVHCIGAHQAFRIILAAFALPGAGRTA